MSIRDSLFSQGFAALREIRKRVQQRCNLTLTKKLFFSRDVLLLQLLLQIPFLRIFAMEVILAAKSWPGYQLLHHSHPKGPHTLSADKWEFLQVVQTQGPCAWGASTGHCFLLTLSSRCLCVKLGYVSVTIHLIYTVCNSDTIQTVVGHTHSHFRGVR